MGRKSKIKIVCFVALCFLFSVVNCVYAVEKEEFSVDFVEDFESLTGEQKVAYLTFDDGPSIYTEALLDLLNEHQASGIFFILGKQLEYIPDADRILKRMVGEGHHIALHTMTHDKHSLYFSEKSPAVFTQEMLELQSEVEKRAGHFTNLCRAPYGKRGHFKVAHHKTVEDAGLYCVDWHVDSKDWEKQNAGQIYDEVIRQLEEMEDKNEIVLLFHEYQRTVDVMPSIISLLHDRGYVIRPYVEGKVFEGLD